MSAFPLFIKLLAKTADADELNRVQLNIAKSIDPLARRALAESEAVNYFFARNAGATQAIPNTTKTTVNLTKELDNRGAFASNAFTVQAGQAGIYFLFGAILYVPSVTLTTARAFITLNDTTTDIGAGSQDGIAQPRTLFAISIYRLAVGDSVKLKTQQVNAGAIDQNITGDGEHTYFGGLRVA